MCCVALLGIAMFLVCGGEDDNDGGSNDSPDEEPNFAPEFPGSWAALAAWCGLTRKQGIFFGDVAVAADVARGAVRKEWARSWHLGE